MATEDDDLLEQAREEFDTAAEAMADNHRNALDDKKFARLGESEQWPADIVRQRKLDGRPCLTVNRMNSFIRQVVNEARQNRPQIKVKPVDSGADIKTADVFSGLIRNIEVASNADVAYDTGLEHAVDGGFGYIRVALEYAHDDTFDQELRIERVADPFCVFGDPYSTAADSADWNTAFVVEGVPEDVFERDFKNAEKVDWDTLGYSKLKAPWVEMTGGKRLIQVADWWRRDEVKKQVVLLSTGKVVDLDVYELHKDIYDAEAVTVMAVREVKSWKVTHRQITGAEILSTTDWVGKYIPIVPVYGDEINIEGERIFRSLIRDAKDPQRMFNYWRTASTELVALAPKVPFIGEEKAFSIDTNWDTVNSKSHPYLMVPNGVQVPQRQPLETGPAVGAMQEALAASDDMKASLGMYDNSLGNRQPGGPQSGRGIIALQKEGDTATFHFVDNQTRAIRHVGRILIDLIPKVYSGPRIARILGEDGKAAMVAIPSREGAMPKGLDGQPIVKDQLPQGISGVFDLAAGKYDLAVEAGPSFATRREEAAYQLTEIIRAFPQAAPILAPALLKNLDIPGVDDIQERLEKMLNPSPEAPQADPAKVAELQAKQETDQRKLDIDAYNAETKRLDSIVKAISPLLAPLVQQELAKLMGSPDITPGGMKPPNQPPAPPAMPPRPNGPMPPGMPNMMPGGPGPQPQPAPAGFSLPGGA